ncbi:hypothetical protein BOX15_Mlig011711g3, partial [Macrostomum lignano]
YMQTSRREELMPSSPVSPAAAAAAADSSSACASNDDDTLHYFRKLLKECRVDEDYDEYLADTGLGQQSPLRPVADSLSGQLMNKLWLSVSPQLVPPEIEEHRATRLPWIIAVSPNGRRLALLKRRQLELYSLKRGLDEALVVIATPPDQFCQWRLMSWSADSQCIAVANSNGGVLVFNIRGQKLCELAPEQVTDNPSGCPLAFLMLESGGGGDDGSTSGGVIVLFTVSISGMLKQFLLDLQQPPQQQQQQQQQFPQTESPQCLSAYNIRDRVAGQPVFCGCYDSVSGTLALGTCTMRHSPTLSAPLQHGIQLWRRISEFPFIKASLALEEDMIELGRSRRLLASVLLRNRSRTDCVTSMALSPDGFKLAASYAYGCVSVWTFPAGNLIATFSLAEQCLSSVRSPHLSRTRVLGVPRRLYPGKPGDRPSGVEWWSEAVLIIVRTNGSVSLLDAATCQSIMGSSPEWFEPYPAVTPPQAGQFLILECEVRKRRARRRRLTSGGQTDSADDRQADDAADYDDDDDDDDRDEEGRDGGLVGSASWAAYRAAHGLLWATGVGLKRLFTVDGGGGGGDNGDFDSPSSSKRSRYTASRDYRIVCFKRTSPAELFQWKLDSDEYGEALLLARNYGLDTDLVYQRQWQMSLMTRSAIDDFLVRINKRHWVLHECLHRVPKDLDSARDLLEFGLRATDVDCFTAIGEGEDQGRLVLTDANIYAEMNYTGERLTAQEERDRLKRNEEEYRSNRLANLDWQKLRPEQRELMRTRRQLLAHLHRLDCYEQVLGGRHRAPERYTAEEFADFRRQTPLGLAVSYARLGNYDAVDHVISHYTDELLPHRLLILSNAAECDSPRQYEFLLPSAGRRLHDSDLLDWPRRVTSSALADWAWRDQAVLAVPASPPTDEAAAEMASLYAEAPESAAAANPLTSAQVAAWLADRARFIEAESLQVDNALCLLELGVERGFTGLDDLLEEVRLLANFVYGGGGSVGGGSSGGTDYLRLANLRDLTELERCQLLISRRESKEDFLSDVTNRLAPHLARLEARQKGLGRDLLRRLLLGLANEGQLGLVAAYVERPPASSYGNSSAAGFLADQALLADVALEAAYVDADSVDLVAAGRLADLVAQLTSSVAPAVVEKAKVLRQRVDACRLVASRRGVGTVSAARSPAALASLDAAKADLLLQQVARQEVQVWCSESVSAGKLDSNSSSGSLVDLQKVTSLLRDLDTLATGALAALVTAGRPIRLLLQCMLSAGQIGLIKSAIAHLELEPGRVPSRRPHVPYMDSVQLITSAAIDYFNSAASATDPTIALAKRCLAYLPATESAVRKELALIEALVALEDLAVPVLPVGLRGHADPAGLICKAIKRQGDLYKRLDDLLRVCDLLALPASASASVQLSAGEAALTAGDFKFASRLCLRLIDRTADPDGQGRLSSTCPDAWRICYALLTRWPDSRSGSAADRLRMARFCTVYCSPDMLEAACDLLEDVECLTAGTAGEEDEEATSFAAVDDPEDAQQASSLTAVVEGGIRGVFKSAATSKRLFDKTLSNLGVDLSKSNFIGLSSKHVTKERSLIDRV